MESKCDTWSSAPRRIRAFTASLIGALFAAGVAAPRAMRAENPPAATRIDHGSWDEILKEYVDEDGRVAYQRLKARDEAKLREYLKTLANADLSGSNERDELAFWINAYNAGIVAAVLAGHSPESTLSRAQLFRWYSFRVAGESRTPDEVENAILRKRFREPRIHFALVCGATSCPRLRREAYRGEVLDQQLDAEARRFINDPERNQIDLDKDIALSSIFDWFASDFSAGAGSVAAFVARYVEDPRRAAALKRAGERIEHLHYDWTLNAQPEQPLSSRESGAESIDAGERRVCSLAARPQPTAYEDPRECAGELDG